MRVWFGIKQLHQCYTLVMLMLCSCFAYILSFAVVFLVLLVVAFGGVQDSTGHTNSGRASGAGSVFKRKDMRMRTWIEENNNNNNNKEESHENERKRVELITL